MQRIVEGYFHLLKLGASKYLAVWRHWRLNAAMPTGDAHGGSAGFLRP